MNQEKRKKNGISGRSSDDEIQKRIQIIRQILAEHTDNETGGVKLTKQELRKIIKRKLSACHLAIPSDSILNKHIKSENYFYSTNNKCYFLKSESFYNIESLQQFLDDNIQQINLLINNNEFVLFPIKLTNEKNLSEKYYANISAAMEKCKKKNTVTFHLKLILNELGFEDTIAKLLLYAFTPDDYYYATAHLKCVELHFSQKLLPTIMKLLSSITNENVYLVDSNL